MDFVKGNTLVPIKINAAKIDVLSPSPFYKFLASHKLECIEKNIQAQMLLFPIETTIPNVVLGNSTLSTFVPRSPFVFMSPIVTPDIASSQMI